MTRPTKQQIEEGAGVKNFTGTWQEGLLNKFGLPAIGFIFATVIYLDYKDLSKQQIEYMRESNGKIVTLVEENGKRAQEGNKVLADLAKTIDQSHENVAGMRKTIYGMEESLNRIESATKKQQ